MQRRKDVSSGLSVFQKFSRGRKLVGLIPPIDVPSDVDNSDEEDKEVVEDKEDNVSSEAPSISSSLERLDLLRDSSDESREKSENSNDENDLLSPIIRKVLPTPTQVNYENIPSLSLIPSLSSPAVYSPYVSHVFSPAVPSPSLPSAATQGLSAVPLTRSKRRIANRNGIPKKKPRKRLAPNIYKWKKTKLNHKAEISCTEFTTEINESSPLDYFSKYFSSDLMDDIVLNTNLYSVQSTGKSINLTGDELKDFISILLIMGVVVMPSYLDYWSKGLRYAKIADIMPLRRFQLIRRYLHFVDNSCPDSDRFGKVRSLIEKVRQNCLSTEEEMKYSVDEMTIPYKGKKAGNRKQYNPAKPDKWGFKCIVRAGMSGIVYDFVLYAGEDTFRFINFTEQEENLTLGAKLVIALCKTIQKRACVVYFDNYFSTLDLAKHLRDNYGIFSLGTVRQNRLRGCDKLLMSDKDMKKKGRGTFCQMVDNENKLAVVKWFDNKIVTFLSSYADAYPVVKIQRYSKEEKTKVAVDCPQVVKHYNQHMGGVDLCDMLVALYRTTYKSRRWYTGIFAQMLDICVNNAWLLYRRDCTRQAAKHISLKSFRCTLANEMQQKSRVSKRQSAPEVNTSKVSVIHAPVQPRPVEAIRYDGVGHWQGFTTYGRCKYCTNNKTEVYCMKCNQRLCMVRKRNCFYQFHNK